MKTTPFLIIFFLFIGETMANVGGRFYQKSVAGIIPDVNSTITCASTNIFLSDTSCTFRTVYKTNTAGNLFKGKFYGLRFSNLKVNGINFPMDSSQISIVEGDSIFINQNLYKVIQFL